MGYKNVSQTRVFWDKKSFHKTADTATTRTTARRTAVQGQVQQQQLQQQLQQQVQGQSGTAGDSSSSDSGSSSGSTAGSGTCSLQLYAYTLRIITPYSLSRTKLNKAVTCLKCLFPDAKVEVV